MFTLRISALAGSLLLAGLAAAQYQVVVLSPGLPWFDSAAFGAALGQQAGFVDTQAGLVHAVLWANSASSMVDLHPSGYDYSYAWHTDGAHQVGYVASGNQTFACVWAGTAASVVLLDTMDLLSQATAVSGTQQVGWTFNGSASHAVLWNGSEASKVDLDPGGFGSGAQGVGGSIQCGWIIGSDFYQHPAMWTGSAGSMVDLLPAGATSGYTSDTDGVQLVGTVDGHAYLWTGGGSSAVDLNGTLAGSTGMGAGGGKQVGFFYPPDFSAPHAAVWSGTSSSFVDLSALLPSNYTVSYATDVATDGTITGYAVDTTTYQIDAVIWIPSGPTLTFAGFLQPINDPAITESVFKRGSVVPVKFKLTNPDGTPFAGAEAHISLTLLGTSESSVNEQDYLLPADDGTQFRYNSGSGAYIFNLGTKNLQAGCRYRVTATYETGSHSVVISIK